MKSTFVAVVLLCLAGSASAQNQQVDSLYIVTYTTGSAWDASKKFIEQQYAKEHSANLSALRKAGTIKFGARYADKGMIVVRAMSLQAAKDMIFADPSVTNKLFNADVQKLNTFYPWKD